MALSRNSTEIGLSVVLTLVIVLLSPGYVVTGVVAVVVLVVSALRLRRNRDLRRRRLR
ncbi:MAG: hypothetical protein M0T77_04115 [Actinomycetota bacterium]|nr:hypothetical protein [Actinomycetota bacterium]